MSLCRPAALVVLAFVIALTLPGCRRAKNEYHPPPPPTVTVALPVQREVSDELIFTGMTAGVEVNEVRARVQGFVDAIHFRPGTTVMPGDLLFTIDPRPFRAKLAEARAQLAGREAELKLAEVTLERARQAAERGAVSDIELRQSQAGSEQARAAVDLAKARVDAEMLQLEFTQVRALIAGQISRNFVDVGALVGAGGATLLATIVSDEKIYAYFDINERELQRLMREHPKDPDGSGRRPVELALSEDEGFPHRGVFDSADNQVNPDTGTIRCRAVFENEGRRIVPGMFARVRVELGSRRALLMPNIALSLDQKGAFALVVNDEGVVARRDVVAGPLYGRLRRIDSGLNPSDWIVVNGVQRARPGEKVAPERTTVEALEAPVGATPPTPAQPASEAATPPAR